MTPKLTIAFTRREAELYRSHGLLEEARQLYRQVLDEAGSLGPSLADSLKEKIRALEAELAELDIALSDRVSERELCILREGWGSAHSAADITTCAAALGSIGLYEAAIDEYCKLIRLNPPLADFIEGLTECLLAVHAPEAIAGAIDRIVDRDQPEGCHPTRLRIAFAFELARRGADEPAVALFASAQAIQPLPDKVERFAKALQKRLRERESPSGEGPRPPGVPSQADTLKIRLANRLARLRGMIRLLRKP